MYMCVLVVALCFFVKHPCSYVRGSNSQVCAPRSVVRLEVLCAIAKHISSCARGSNARVCVSVCVCVCVYGRSSAVSTCTAHSCAHNGDAHVCAHVCAVSGAVHICEAHMFFAIFV